MLYIKRSLVIVLLFSMQQMLVAQPTTILEDTTGRIFALIVGISIYEDDSIENLSYAHRDAEKFYSYLTSKAGGAVPSKNIRFLSDSTATMTNIYNAKKELQDSLRKGDAFFFYFSGHGDVENDLFEDAFFLAHDTPHKNYEANAVEINHINKMANNLSVGKGVKVIIITDACRSGKLNEAGSRGSQLAAKQIREAKNKETRITSCNAEQESYEAYAWGKGRGAFSYYLIKGLKGEADSTLDGVVTKWELENYLELKVPSAVFEETLKEQDPVVEGKKHATLSILRPSEDTFSDSIPDDDVFADAGNPSDSNNKGSRGIGSVLRPVDRYFNSFTNIDIKHDIDFKQWMGESTDEQMGLFLSQYPINENSKWKEGLLSDQGSIKGFKNRMASELHNNVQGAINAYLRGDKEELERREYYNAKNSNFGEYVFMMEIAIGLVDTSHDLHSICKFKKHYLAGLSERLNITLSENPDENAAKAMLEQKLALSMNENAAYVHNELGILYHLKKEYDKADFHYKRASELVPTWAIPISNLSGLNRTLGKIESGFELAKKALKIEPNYANAYLNLGASSENMGDLLLAEESYVNAKNLGPNHYLPYLNLAFVYTSEFKFSEADEYFYQAKNTFRGMDVPGGIVDLKRLKERPNLNSLAVNTCLDESKMGPDDLFANVVAGMNYFIDYENEKSRKFLLNAIGIDTANPLAFRYLGELAIREKNWIEAEMFLKLAKKYYLNRDEFEAHIGLSKMNQNYLECEVERYYVFYHFSFELLSDLFGDTYSGLGYDEDAIKAYREYLTFNSVSKVVRTKLLALYESKSKYLEAERLLENYCKVDKSLGTYELVSFYNRMISKGVNLDYYNRRAAFTLYELIFGVKGRNYEDYNSFEKDIFINGTLDLNDRFQLEASENNPPASKIYTPGLLSLGYFKALESSINALDQANIFYKMGMLCKYIGDIKQSAQYFKKAVESNSVNGSIVLELVENNIMQRKLSSALFHLDNLYKKGNINYTYLMPLVEYYTHSGRFVEAESVVEKLEETYPFDVDGLAFAKAKLSFFSGDEKAVDNFYDLWESDKTNAHLCYSLARVYAFQGKKSKAFKYLEKALDNGFAYNYVLDQDFFWDNLRSDKKWKELRNRNE